MLMMESDSRIRERQVLGCIDSTEHLGMYNFHLV
ncbi:unnamed protein product [Musa acuminata subsp. malaccensis]|uniref:(wild Malaysian banana) hypothetical protein n=1 Tax=Musa acuminata subsp. malaccensis TaxID=214687 RepID=A0A804KFY5_MUSAM|nr:unnamed protein product [Musa acuminata subsp. malaccensis]